MLRAWRIAAGIALILCAEDLLRGQTVSPRAAANRGGVQRGPASAPYDGLDKLAIQAVDDGKLKEFAASLVPQIEPLFGQTNLADLDHLTRLAAYRQFGLYFAKIEKITIDQVDTLQWLATKPKLLSTLCLAVGAADSPENVLEALQLLREDQQDHLDDFADLATAMCVVWDEPSLQSHGLVRPDPKPNRAAARTLMRFYINARAQLRFDPADLPWQLSIYLVDNLAEPEEISWAIDHYGRRNGIGNVFFDVPYDTEAYRGTSALKIADKPYTLPNLLQYGGVCGDQAYFAAQVARSIGVPATICIGKTSEVGEGHAWVGYLDVQSGRVAWNFEEGRYAIYQFWKGDVVDPQTRETITDADVSLLAELQKTSSRQRLASAALTRAADLADPARQADVYMQAISLSPGNRRAWMDFSALAAQNKLDAKQANALTAAVTKFALHPYPDFAFEVLRRSIMGRGTLQQARALEDMNGLFVNRPDIQAAIGLALGDVYLKDQRTSDALSAYGDVIQRNTAVAPIVLEAMQRVDKMLRKSDNLPQLAAAYDLVWKRMPRPDATVIVQATPYYRIGESYEKLLLEMGDQNTAQQVQSRLDSLTQSVTAIHQ